MYLKLERSGQNVYHEGKQLTIVAQLSKGVGKEVVKIDGLPGSNGQKYVSLARLVEGKNELLCKAKDISTITRYSLNEAEAAEVAKLEARINEIKENAKARYVAKPNFNVKVEDMTKEQKEAELAKMKKFLGLE